MFTRVGLLFHSISKAFARELAKLFAVRREISRARDVEKQSRCFKDPESDDHENSLPLGSVVRKNILWFACSRQLRSPSVSWTNSPATDRNFELGSTHMPLWLLFRGCRDQVACHVPSNRFPKFGGLWCPSRSEILSRHSGEKAVIRCIDSKYNFLWTVF